MNWKEQLKKAIDNQATQEELEEMKRLSRDWNFCYIGENRKKLNILGIGFRHGFGSPEHVALFRLGCDFSYAVADDKFEEALIAALAIDKSILEIEIANKDREKIRYEQNRLNNQRVFKRR